MAIFKQSGNFKNTENFLNKATKIKVMTILTNHARQGVSALSAATPKDTAKTSLSWDYEIKLTTRGYTITWTNSNVHDGVPIVILLQYGHGTGSGGYVQGRDFINPALKPIVDGLAEKLWEEVSSL